MVLSFYTFSVILKESLLSVLLYFVILQKRLTFSVTIDLIFSSSVAESKKRSLFVKNLGFDVKDAEIKAHFPLAQKIYAPRKMDGKLKG